LFKRFERDL
jgi:hypothetical protein